MFKAVFIGQLLTLILAIGTLTSADPINPLLGDRTIANRQASSTRTSSTSAPDASCTNSALTRQCWKGGWSIGTDYDNNFPNTGVIRSYHLEITNTTCSPDGVSRPCLLVNGQLPGPTIIADWGDTLSITVTNSMKDNGTSIHWHGIRQYNTDHMDGTNGITECPLAPGKSKTYTFLCTQFGSSWYHSHFSAQYGDGVLGAIKINGPCTANYDTDLGTMTVQDWYYGTATQESILAAGGARGPPVADNGLINGTMTNPNGGGAYLKTPITKGKKYLLCLINTALDNHFRISLDGHNLTVVQADFIPATPVVKDWFFLGIGQRICVIINANQAVGNYWLRAEVQTQCGANTNNGNIKSIFSYSGAPASEPNTVATTYTQSCLDDVYVPYFKKDVPSATFVQQAQNLNVTIVRSVATNGQNIVTWNVNGSALNVDWEKPTLQYVLDGNTSYPPELNVISLPQKNVTYFWIIQETLGTVALVPHPIHLHGHDFYVLGTGQGTFDKSMAAGLQWTNPPRRDVAMLPASGWLVIGFYTDNPGAWLMHCHIAWHVGEGLGVQFLERASEIPSTLNIPPSWETGCQDWDNYYATSYYKKDDSGL